MEWLDMATKLGLSGTSLLLAGAVYTLWKKLETKDAEIARLNEQHSKTLSAISRSADES